MEMLEKEDGIMGKEGVRGLRETLGREAYEVVSDQRYVRFSEVVEGELIF